MRDSLESVDTPAVVVNRAQLGRNIDRIQAIAATHGLRVRPHAKTHKCHRIARLQLEAGAVGLTCAKSEEALYFLREGVSSITVAYPLIAAAKVERLLATAQETGAEIRLMIDSDLGVEVISGVAKRLGASVGILIKIDVGLHRCGVDKDNPRLVELAAAIDRAESLNLIGILSHAGQAYAVETHNEVTRIAEEERRIMVEVQERLRSNGLEIREVSVGSTPTVLACENFDGVTEIRPGNYVFMDRSPLRFGLIDPQEIALSVVATIVSSNDRYLIVDAGSKVLSSDGPGHGLQAAQGFGLATPLEEQADPGSGLIVEKLSEEHGWIAHRGRSLPLGSRVQIIPNHSCVVANLTDQLVVSGAGGEVTDTWPVGARGLVR